MSSRQNGRTPGPAQTQALGSSVNSTLCRNDSSQHLAEADVRLESCEAGLSRVALGLEPVDTIPSYVRLIQTARLHLRAVA